MARPAPVVEATPAVVSTVTVYRVVRDAMTGGWRTITAQVPEPVFDAGVESISEAWLVPGQGIDQDARDRHERGEA